MDSVQMMINEARTVEDYQQACLVVQQRIRGGQEVSWRTLHSLAVKGHLIALENATSLERAEMIAAAYIRTHRTDPK